MSSDSGRLVSSARTVLRLHCRPADQQRPSGTSDEDVDRLIAGLESSLHVGNGITSKEAQRLDSIVIIVLHRHIVPARIWLNDATVHCREYCSGAQLSQPSSFEELIHGVRVDSDRKKSMLLSLASEPCQPDTSFYEKVPISSSIDMSTVQEALMRWQSPLLRMLDSETEILEWMKRTWAALYTKGLQPWAPIVDLVVAHTVFRALSQLGSVQFLTKTVASHLHDDHGKDSAQSVVTALCRQVQYLITSKQNVAQPLQLELYAEFYSVLASNYEVPQIQSELLRLTSIEVLAAHVSNFTPSTGEGIFPRCQGLENLCREYRADPRCILRDPNAPRKDAICFHGLLWKAAELVHSFENADAMDVDELQQFQCAEALYSILRLLVSLTGQPPLGRYISWFLAFWNAYESAGNHTHSHVRNAMWCTFLERLWNLSTHSAFLPTCSRRKVASASILCQRHMTQYLRNTNGSLPSEFADPAAMYKEFAGLLSLNSPFPDLEYMSDMLSGDFFFPRFDLYFCSWSSYLVHNYVLYKASMSLSLLQSLLADLQPQSRPQYFRAVPIVSLEKDGNGEDYVVTVRKEGALRNASHDTVSDICGSHALLVGVDTSEGGDQRAADAVALTALCGGWLSRPLIRGQDVILRLKADRDLGVFGGRRSLTHLYLVEPTANAYSSVLDAVQSLYTAIYSSSGGGGSGTAGTATEFLPEWLLRMVIGHLSPQKVMQAQYGGIGADPLVDLSESQRMADGDNGVTIDLRGLVTSFDSIVSFFSDTGREFQLDISSAYAAKGVRLRLQKSGETVASFTLRVGEAFNTGTRAMQLYDAQQKAVLSSLFNNLTIVIGPPGTGKTDVTCSSIAVICESLCRQGRSGSKRRIGIVTHSNLALDQVIDKLQSVYRSRKWKPPALLRLGSQVTNDAARMCTPRGYLSAAAQKVLGVLEYTEVSEQNDSGWFMAKRTALYRQLSAELEKEDYAQRFTAVARDVETFLREVFSKHDSVDGRTGSSLGSRVSVPPVSRSDADRSLAKVFHVGSEFAGDVRQFVEAARVMWRGPLQDLLMPWRKFQASLLERAEIVALTASGAALRQEALSDLQFDFVVVEEAAKVLETEMIALLSKAQRLVLVGDHLQLAPLVQHSHLRSVSRYNQSLFQRLQRIGVRPIWLDHQGRAAPAIADLYRWRYEQLSDLPHTAGLPLPALAAKFPQPLAFLDVADGRCESETNAREALVLMDCVQWIVSRGTDADDISIITPYKRQKFFLQKEFETNEVAVRDISTVDEFQGLQNRVVLVSLVLTGARASPFLRSSSRINVLCSRARSLLVFVGKLDTFDRVDEWRQVLDNVSQHNGGQTAWSDHGKACHTSEAIRAAFSTPQARSAKNDEDALMAISQLSVSRPSESASSTKQTEIAPSRIPFTSGWQSDKEEESSGASDRNRTGDRPLNPQNRDRIPQDRDRISHDLSVQQDRDQMRVSKWEMGEETESSADQPALSTTRKDPIPSKRPTATATDATKRVANGDQDRRGNVRVAKDPDSGVESVDTEQLLEEWEAGDDVDTVDRRQKKPSGGANRRKAPTVPAKGYAVGFEMVSENDGKVYTVAQLRNGVKRWQEKR